MISSKIKNILFINFFSYFVYTQCVEPEVDAFKAVAYSTHGSQNANQFFQKLGKEAYKLARLPKHQFAAIKCLAPQSPLYNDKTRAVNCNGEVFVRQDGLEEDKNNLGLIRLGLIHEMIHRKQFDKNVGNFCVLNPNVYNSIEKEADIEAAYRGNCAFCTKGYAEGTCSEKETSKKAQEKRAAGYATQEELLAIAKKQEKCHARCKHHRCVALQNTSQHEYH